jgi:hypothetical protein
MSGHQPAAVRPASSNLNDIEQTINQLRVNMLAIKRLATSRSKDDCDRFLLEIPAYFETLAQGFQRCMQTPSWDIHEAFTPLLRGNSELIVSIDSGVQDLVIEHFLKHFPLPLKLVSDIRFPSPQTSERMAQSLVTQLPVLICRDTDLAQYYRFMAESFSVQAFTQFSEKLFGLIRDNLSDPDNTEGEANGALAQAATMTNTLLGYHRLSGTAEFRNNPPPELLLLLAEHQDMIINIREKKIAIGLIDMDCIEMLYGLGFEPLADHLCKEWILTYPGTGLIHDLKFQGFDKPIAWFDELRAFKDSNPKLPCIYELNLLEQSLIDAQFKVELVAESFMVGNLDDLYEMLQKYSGKGSEEPLQCPEQLGRIGKLIDQICTINQVAAKQIPGLLTNTVYWEYSEVLSASRLEQDLGL